MDDADEGKRTSRLNAAMLRISRNLNEYSSLEELLGYISGEIKQLLESEGALVILLDVEANELYFPGIAYDNPDTEERVREVRFTKDQLVAGRVIQTGEPVIINDMSKEGPYLERDRKLGYRTRSLAQVPIFSDDRIIGTLIGLNKIRGEFSQKDIDRLNTLAGTVALAIENARYAEELKKVYQEVRELNKAKDRAINHLSHELKNPVAILSEAVRMLEDEFRSAPGEDWKLFINMIHRNLKRITAIQEEVADIIRGRHLENPWLMSWMFDQCVDELSLIVARESGKGALASNVKKRIEELFYVHEPEYKKIPADTFVGGCIEDLKQESSFRSVHITSHLEKGRYIHIPEEILRKIVDGLIKNAVENTPDGGAVDVRISGRGEKTVLMVADSGVGIPDEYQRRIFGGFFPTQEMAFYSTRKPFDFNAGGKGIDLLRMKTFSERYDFIIEMNSSRCTYLDGSETTCPGVIEACPGCRNPEECRSRGGTSFLLQFSRSESEWGEVPKASEDIRGSDVRDPEIINSVIPEGAAGAG